MVDSKYDIKIGDFGFVVGRHQKLLTHVYTRDEAPAFVNKFSSGDPNYRDATFFSTWVDLDWLNGFNQEFFDDPSKFFYSNGVDTSKMQQLTLEKAFSSTGTVGDGQHVQTEAAWRTPASSYFGDGGDSALTISADTTQAPYDSACSGTQGTTSLTATHASFTAGQKILIHQTQGTNAGNWERNEISTYATGTITTVNALAYSYSSSGSNKAQVIVIPEYTNVTIDSGKIWTAKAWDGTVGGILVFLASGTLTVTGTISANGKGFAGGAWANQSYGDQGDSQTTTGTYTSSANGGGGGGGRRETGGGADDAAGGGGGGYGAAGSNGTYTGYGIGGGTYGNASLTSCTLGSGGGSGGGSYSGTYAGGNGGAGGGWVFGMAKTISITGGIQANGGAGSAGADRGGGGGGSGGAVLLKGQTITLGSSLVTASAGAGASTGHGGNGGNGGAGRIHIDYYTSYSGSTTPTLDYTQDSTLTSTELGSSYTLYVGTSGGKIYSWDGASTYTEAFDVNRLEWYESGVDSYYVIGDAGGTEQAGAQGFQVDETMYIGGIEVYIKKENGTPGDITVRIETDSSSKPSGTLASANLTATIPAFATTSYGWKTVSFATPAQLTADTTYHLVLKTSAAANDNDYNWANDASSPSYSSGAASYSTDGGSTWTAASGVDMYFRILGESTGVTCSTISDIAASTTKLYFGTGNSAVTHTGGARIYSFDGTNWAVTKMFTGTTDSYVGAMTAFGSVTPGVYIGMGHKAKVYYTADMATFTVSKSITEPRNPGYVLAMVEYNGQLMVGGGYPEQLYGSSTMYSGFLYYYDEYQWGMVGSFEHTVVTSLESFDTMLFVGTIHKRLYVYNTATIDKLFEFPWDVQIIKMCKWDDKLTLAVAPTPGYSASGYEGVYVFDRNGLHLAFSATSRTWYSLFVFNNNLIAGGDTGYVYTTNATNYQSSGWLQTSYFEASLPSIDKLLREVTLQYETLPSGCSIDVYYKFKESDDWTSLGTADTESSIEDTSIFGVDVYSKKVCLKIVLETSDTTHTPTLKKIITKYQIAPDIKYIWKMTLVCPDNMKWGDETVPIAKIGTGCTAGDTTLTLTTIEGFPDPNGSTAYASVILADGTVDTFSYTEIDTGNVQLTGIPATGTYALATHAAGLYVKVLGRDIHRVILDLKTAKKFYTLTDVDSLTYTVYFSSYQTDNWVLDLSTGSNLIENEVPITLLEA